MNINDEVEEIGRELMSKYKLKGIKIQCFRFTGGYAEYNSQYDETLRVDGVKNGN